MIIKEISYSNQKNWPQLFYPVDNTIIIGLLLTHSLLEILLKNAF